MCNNGFPVSSQVVSFMPPTGVAVPWEAILPPHKEVGACLLRAFECMPDEWQLWLRCNCFFDVAPIWEPDRPRYAIARPPDGPGRWLIVVDEYVAFDEKAVPRPSLLFLVFHEIAHAKLGHAGAFDEAVRQAHEKAADVLALEWLKAAGISEPDASELDGFYLWRPHPGGPGETLADGTVCVEMTVDRLQDVLCDYIAAFDIEADESDVLRLTYRPGGRRIGVERRPCCSERHRGEQDAPEVWTPAGEFGGGRGTVRCMKELWAELTAGC